jgi:hypothetical protein
VPYRAHPLIAAFAEHFGQPTCRATVDERTRQIVALDVVRDAGCGCARYVAERLASTLVDEAIEAGGLHHHHYPCQASMGIDPQYGDTLMHVSGNIMKDALREALEPYLQTRYVRPAGYSEADDSTRRLRRRAAKTGARGLRTPVVLRADGALCAAVARSLFPVFEQLGGFFGVAGFVADHVLKLDCQPLIAVLVGLLGPLDVVFAGLKLGFEDGLQHVARVIRRGNGARRGRRLATERGDLVGQELGVHQLVLDLGLHEGHQLGAPGAGHSGRIGQVLDHRLQFAGQVFVQRFDQCFFIHGKSKPPEEWVA